VNAQTALRAPASLRELFTAFTWLALQGFGGVLAVAQRELVERLRWLDREQFVELLAISQVLPGPNIVNLAIMYGDRHFGWRGALAATAGLLAVPLAIVLVLAGLYAHFSQVPQVAGALRGMGAVAAGLVLAAAFKLGGTLSKSPLGVAAGTAIAAATAVAVGALRWPLVWAVLVLGSVGYALAWRALGRKKVRR
jgi:chromate transporter